MLAGFLRLPGLERWARFGPDGQIVRLFGRGGPFARFPGPVVCIEASGRTVAANSAGAHLAGLMDQGRLPQLAEIVAQALEQGAAKVTSVTFPAEGTVLEVAVIPFGPSEAGAPDTEASPAGFALLVCRDATLERNLNTTLIESRQRYRDLVNVSSDFAWETDRDGAFAFVSPRGALGYRADELVGRNPREFVLDQRSGDDLPFSTRSPLADAAILFRRADGLPACLLVSCLPVVGADGQWQGARGICRDVTEARERDAALARARTREQLLAHIVGQIRDEIKPVNMMNAAAEATAKALGASGCRIYRVAAEEGFTVAAEFGEVPVAPPAPLEGLGSGPEHARAQAEGCRALAVATRYRRAINGAISLWRDAGGKDWDEDDFALLAEVASQLGIAIQQLKNHEELERLSRTDALTGLLNRRVFLEEVGRRLAHAGRTGRPGALCYLDLDNFKAVNDLHGHHRGDAALKAVAELLTGNSRVHDLLARLGGDEFAIWLEESERSGAAVKARALLSAAAALAEYSGDAEHPLGLSIGIAVHDPACPETLKELMARADQAMYAVKRAGKGGFRVADPAPHPAAGAGAAMEAS
jgi:diguanylate cyclase (GGDEF)-like protein/PAS domain S-box-containing protein